MKLEVLYTLAAVDGRGDELATSLLEHPATVEVQLLGPGTINWRARFATPLPSGAADEHVAAQAHELLAGYVLEPPGGVAWLDAINPQYIEEAGRV